MIIDIRAIIAFGAGRWAEAATLWLEVAGISDLNQPYVLPRAGHAFVLAGDDAGAEGTLERLRALGTRGRAVDADRAAIAAGIAALRGDPGGGADRLSHGHRPRGVASGCRGTRRSRSSTQ